MGGKKHRAIRPVAPFRSASSPPSMRIAGRDDEAGLAMQQLRQLDPELRLSNLGEWLPFQRPQDLAIFADGLRKAGLPE